MLRFPTCALDSRVSPYNTPKDELALSEDKQVISTTTLWIMKRQILTKRSNDVVSTLDFEERSRR